MLSFLTAKNLVDHNLIESAPWIFNVDPAANPFRRMPKAARRMAMLKPETAWNVYTPIVGVAKNQRISKTNPAKEVRGLVADYDMVSDIETILKYLNQVPQAHCPNFAETSLGNKVRLVWVFEQALNVPSTEFASEFVSKFFDKLGVPALLAGYDPASTKPTEMWTNGAVWYDLNPTPMPWATVFGVACETSKKASLFNKGEIQLTKIYDEIQKRWPGRWQGDFQENSLGVRFWDETADNPTGCQVKPDGILCFTGNQPFMKWEQLLGREWCEEQKVLNLGRAGEGIYFDGRDYWELSAKVWQPLARADVLLRLTGRGLSSTRLKGCTQSDAERVLDHIQQHNRVLGAAPLVNYPRGLVTMEDESRILNTATLNPVLPVKGPTGTPEDFPWIARFLGLTGRGLFTVSDPTQKPLDYLLSWTKRAQRSVLEFRRDLGQAIFLCGPRNNGKTLLCTRIIAPLLGRKMANPMEFMTGETSFNSELFESFFLAVNDEDSPSGAARQRMTARLKSLVVNSSHKYHAKFARPVNISWTGRIMVTLNDDPGSVGVLLEVEQNTYDKQMFFATQGYEGVFPDRDELEATIAKELPYFGWWLQNVYKIPDDVRSDDRMGIKSYFDPRIHTIANQQTYAANLAELIDVWRTVDAYWAPNVVEWKGTPTHLLSCFQACPETSGLAREWTVQKVSKSLTTLAKQEGSFVRFTDGTRIFTILK